MSNTQNEAQDPITTEEELEQGIVSLIATLWKFKADKSTAENATQEVVKTLSTICKHLQENYSE
jgi:hypothetical protein